MRTGRSCKAGAYRMSAPELMMAASARARWRKRRCASRFCSRRRSSCSCRSSAMAAAESTLADGEPSVATSQDRVEGLFAGMSQEEEDGAGEQRRELRCELEEGGGVEES